MVTVLRWLAVLPLAGLAGIAVYALSILSAEWGSFGLVRRGEGFYGWLLDFTAHITMGVAFVAAGAKLAPAREKAVGGLLAAVAVTFAGVGMYAAIAADTWWLGVLSLGTGAGGIGTAILVWSDTQSFR